MDRKIEEIGGRESTEKRQKWTHRSMQLEIGSCKSTQEKEERCKNGVQKVEDDFRQECGCMRRSRQKYQMKSLDVFLKQFMTSFFAEVVELNQFYKCLVRDKLFSKVRDTGLEDILHF